MATPPGDVRSYATDEDLIQLVDSLFGLKVTSCKRLNGYEDLNLLIKVNLTEYNNSHISSPCQLGYVVKVLNTQDSLLNKDHVAGQVDLLKVLRDGGVTCPQHVPDKQGRLFSEQQLPDKTREGTTMHIVRLLEYLEGDILESVGASPKLAFETGQLAGKMINITKGYKDGRLVKHNYLFHHDSIPQLRDYLHFVTNEEHKAIAVQFITKWESLQEAIAALPRGMLHYDVNEQNILVQKSSGRDWEVSAIIDFQDCAEGHYVYEIGNAIMYLMTVSDTPMDVGGYCLKGFLKEHKLSQAELDVLYYCVCARFAVSLVLGLYYYSVSQDPYTLVTQRCWKMFEQLWEQPAQKMLMHWMSDQFQGDDS